MVHKFLVRISLILTLFTGILLITYTSYRAYVVPISHDEAATFKNLQDRTIHDIVTYGIPEDHMLNSLLMKAFMSTIGNSEWVLRLPNLIAHVIFLIYSFLLIRKFGRMELLFPAFLVLNMNPYFLDFLSCARGYGISSAFILPAFYYLMSYIRDSKISHLLLTLLMATLSVLALITLMNFYLAVTGIIFLFLTFNLLLEYRSGHQRRKSILAYSALIVVSAALFLYLIDPVVRLSGRSFVTAARSNNFYEATIRPIVFRSIYTKDSGNLVTIISYSLIITYISALLFLIIQGVSKKREILKNPLLIILMISLMIVFSLIFQFELFQIRFPFDRSAILFIPVVVIFLMFFLFSLYETRYLRWIGVVLFIFLASASTYNVLHHANARYFCDWDYDQSGKKMITDLERFKGEAGNHQVELGAFWIYEPSANYYRVHRNYTWLKEITRDSLQTKQFDFYYLRTADTVGMNFKPADVLVTYPPTNTLLLRGHK